MQSGWLQDISLPAEVLLSSASLFVAALKQKEEPTRLYSQGCASNSPATAAKLMLTL
jgi:hypothetical protein